MNQETDFGGRVRALALWVGVASLLLMTGPFLAPAPRAAQKQPTPKRVVLQGNVPKFVRPSADYGFTNPKIQMRHMILALKLRPDKKAELDTLLKEQQDPTSPHYHCWLTPQEFGKRFGATEQELTVAEGWLRAQGFKIDSVAKGGLWINFSGSVSTVEQAFHTQIHNYLVKGKMYHANATNPSIPGRLGSVVAGVVSLNNYPLRPMNTGLRSLSNAKIHPEYTNGSTHYMSPGDFAIIYDVNAAYNAGITGQGVTIAIVGRTHPTNLLDAVSQFQSNMALPNNPPTVIVNGTDPGDIGSGEDDEAELDVEWSGAVAKGATIDFVISKSTSSTDGVDLSAQYIVDNDLAPVMSTSFGQCESQMGSTENTFYNNLWAQAASEGITAFVSAGDSGASGCDSGSSSSGSGQAISGLSSTPYDVCVGGTEMNEGSGTYWSTTNSSGYTSALSYIPEMAWNESGATPSCPSGDSCSGLWATGGGVSTVYSKPSWQVAPGVPSDGQRDCPDVSLAAAAGHDGAIVYLEDGTNNGLSVIGGTSWSSPSWAGVMALVVQKMGGQGQGNANPRLYQLGNEQYTSGSPVVFHDVTSGNNSVPNVTGYSCTTGYDLATGLGSVDVNALVNHWAACTTPGTPSGLTAGVPGANEINLSWTAGSPAGSTYNVYRAVGSCPGSGYALLAGGVTSTTYKDLTVSGGTTYSYEVTAVDNTGGCESAKSACASAAATGACTLPPTFAGLSSVSSPGNTSCELDLSWPAATANCGKSVYYNVYRSTSASFNPSASNRVATGITATSYADTNNLASGTTYYYMVRAVDTSNSSEDSNSTEKSGLPTGTTTTMIDENFEEAGHQPTSGGSWTHSAGQGTDNWVQSTSGDPHSPAHTFFAADVTTVNDDYLVTPSFTVPANATLSFWHTYYLESDADYGGSSTTGYDGAVIEISTDGGSTWNDLGSDITQGGYDSTMYTGSNSPIAGRQAWSGGAIGTETQVRVDLSSFSGQTAQIRFRLACDQGSADTGWYIDDVVLSGYVSCATVTGVRPVPDGKWISGTPMKATRSDSGGRTIGLTWDVSTCQDPNYNVYYGNGSAVSTYTLTGSACGIGNSGTAAWNNVPSIPSGEKFIWWVLTGTDGVNTESSWGKDSAGNQRHPAASGQCGFTAKSTDTTCP